MLVIYVLIYKYFFVIVIVCVLNLDSGKLFVRFLVIIDIDIRVVDFLVLLNVIERLRYYFVCKINKSIQKINVLKVLIL